MFLLFIGSFWYNLKQLPQILFYVLDRLPGLSGIEWLVEGIFYIFGLKFGLNLSIMSAIYNDFLRETIKYRQIVLVIVDLSPQNKFVIEQKTRLVFPILMNSDYLFLIDSCLYTRYDRFMNVRSELTRSNMQKETFHGIDFEKNSTSLK